MDTNEALDRALGLLNRIQSALGTDETGDALVEVARNAHKAEQELARYKKLAREWDRDDAVWEDATNIVEMLKR